MSGRTPPGPASGRGHELTDPRRPSLWIHMMRKNLGSVVAVVALVLVGAASAASSNSQPVLRPFVAGGALAFGRRPRATDRQRHRLGFISAVCAVATSHSA